MSGQQLVGQRVRVWWDGDKCFYPGIVAEFIPSTQLHVVKCVPSRIIVVARHIFLSAAHMQMLRSQV